MKAIISENAPAAVGPFCHAMECNGMLYVSGQLPLDPKTMAFPSDDVQEQARQCLENVRSVLAEAGCTVDSVVKTTVFIKDMNDFAKVNEVYAEFFGGHKPARACVEVARLPMDAKVEVELIAALG